MEEKKIKKFKIDDKDISSQEQIVKNPIRDDNSNYERLNLRLTIISIIIFCLIFVIAFFVYLSLKKNINVGTTKVNKNINEINYQFSKLDKQYKNSTQETQETIKNLKNDIEYVGAFSRQVKKDLEIITQEQEKYLANANAQISDKLKQSIKQIENTFRGEIFNAQQIAESNRNIIANKLEPLLEKISERLNKELDLINVDMNQNKRKIQQIFKDIQELKDFKKQQTEESALVKALANKIGEINDNIDKLDEKINSATKKIKDIITEEINLMESKINNLEKDIDSKKQTQILQNPETQTSQE